MLSVLIQKGLKKILGFPFKKHLNMGWEHGLSSLTIGEGMGKGQSPVDLYVLMRSGLRNLKGFRLTGTSSLITHRQKSDRGG